MSPLKTSAVSIFTWLSMKKNKDSERDTIPRHNMLDANKSLWDKLLNFAEGFIEIDDEGKITFSSNEILNLLGSTKLEILNADFWEVAAESPVLTWLLAVRQDVEDNENFQKQQLFEKNHIWLFANFITTNNSTSLYLKKISNKDLDQQKLNKEQQELNQFFDLSPLPQWVYDYDTLKFLLVNNAAIQHYGYSAEEFLSMTIADIRSSEELEILGKILQFEVKFGVRNQAIVNHRLKNGQVRQVRVESNSITYANRNARLVLAMDWTNRFLAQDALLKSENRFKALLQNSSDVISIIDEFGFYKYVNESSIPLLSLPPEELIGRSAFELIHLEDREMVMQQLSTINENKQIKLPPFRLFNGKKKYRWLETILTDMRDDENINGIMANSRDITDTVVAKIKAQKNIERYEIVSKATSDAIWDWNLANGKITWNKGIKGVFGYPRTMYSLAWYRDRIHPEDEQDVIQEYKKALANGTTRLTIEYRFRCADGSYKHVLDRSFIIFNALKQPLRMIGSMQDISQKIAYIHTIEQHNKTLQEISWLQSHAVRAPLARILGLTQLIGVSDADEADWDQLLKHLHSSAQELDCVIANIIKTADN